MKDNNQEVNSEAIEDMKQAYSLLFVALNKIQAEADSKLEKLTARQLMLLIAIAHLENKEPNIVNISSAMRTSKQNVNRFVKAMIKNGYLVSHPSKEDGRSINITITKKGRLIMNMNIERSNQYFLELFSDFSTVELKLFRELLSKITAIDQQNPNIFEEKIKI